MEKTTRPTYNCKSAGHGRERYGTLRCSSGHVQLPRQDDHGGPADALPGRATRPYAVNPGQYRPGDPTRALAGGLRGALPGDGLLLGVERIFWRQPGVVNTAVGYMGGLTPNPTYEESCTGRTGHAETVQVVYDPTVTSAEALLKVFWENHDPTQGMRQGNDIGTAYRSAIYWTTDGQRAAAEATRLAFQRELTSHRYGAITTEVRPATEAGAFYLGEDYHQQYPHKNPGGYFATTDPTG